MSRVPVDLCGNKISVSDILACVHESGLFFAVVTEIYFPSVFVTTFFQGRRICCEEEVKITRPEKETIRVSADSLSEDNELHKAVLSCSEDYSFKGKVK